MNTPLLDYYLLVLGCLSVLVATRLHVAADDTSFLGVFRRAMRMGGIIGGITCILVALRSIASGG